MHQLRHINQKSVSQPTELVLSIPMSLCRAEPENMQAQPADEISPNTPDPSVWVALLLAPIIHTVCVLFMSLPEQGTSKCHANEPPSTNKPGQGTWMLSG